MYSVRFLFINSLYIVAFVRPGARWHALVVRRRSRAFGVASPASTSLRSSFLERRLSGRRGFLSLHPAG